MRPSYRCSCRSLLVPIAVVLVSVMMSLAMGFLGSEGLSRTMSQLTGSSFAAAAVDTWLQGLAHATVDRIHVIVLVHGWMGNPAELGYLQSAIESYAEQNRPNDQHVYVYSVVGNDGRTSDGIAAGGNRVAEEVNTVLAHLAPQAPSELSLSFVGHSLGGLYARYALRDIRWQHPVASRAGEEEAGDDRVVSVQPRVFATTASPHLGVAGYTYLPIPRAAQYAIAHAMQPTGRDLFRFTDTIERMTIDPDFMEPLSQFKERLAYACAHSTDFQVPTATAAFLAESDTRHRRIPVDREEPFVAMAVETDRRSVPPVSHETGRTTEEPLEAGQLADRLDALGWRKVFYDVRDTLPSLVNPFGKPSAEESSVKDDYTSAELLQEFGSWKSERIHFPLGHNILVANAKNPAYAKINAAGQPVMDQLAAYLVNKLTGRVPSEAVTE